MKLTSLTVQSFRGFGRREEFALGDVNILAGPNGFGKTSFFDAALWCLFNSIPRLGGTRDFVQAKDVCQNKFSKTTYSVQLTFDTPDGPLSLMRRPHAVEANIRGKPIEEKDCLERLSLHDEEGIDRFLRNFLLEQEKINDFVRELSPRKRYDSMISILRFETPTVLENRIEALASVLGRQRDGSARDLEHAEAKAQRLRADVEALQEAGKSISYDVAEGRYKTVLEGAGDGLLEQLGFDTAKMSQTPLRARILALIECASNALSDLGGLEAQLHRFRLMRTERALANDQASLDEQVHAREPEIILTERTISATESQLTTCRDEIRVQKTKIDANTQTQGKVRAVLSEIKAIVASDVCPVCKRPIDRIELLAVIDREIGASGIETARLIEELNRQDGVRRALEEELQRLRSLFAQQRTALQALRQTLEDRNKLDAIFHELQSSPSARRWRVSLGDIGAPIPDLARERGAAEALHRDATMLSRMVDSLVASSTLPDLARRQEEATREAANLLGSIRELQGGIATLEKCRASVSAAQVALVQTTLESYKPLIRSLYRRMHPHQLFTEIDFDVTQTAYGGEIYFRVFTPERQTDAYPAAIFSASQLNVLAVSIFLAMNLRTESPVPMVMLDDPIHSMDDLNVLGFCDVVRQIKSRRQLFISTHNRDLYGLLLNKLRPAHPDESVCGFWFEDWSEAGPTIRREIPEYIPTRIEWSEIQDIHIKRPA
jgi:chromosome segregation ATPase